MRGHAIFYKQSAKGCCKAILSQIFMISDVKVCFLIFHSSSWAELLGFVFLEITKLDVSSHFLYRNESPPIAHMHCRFYLFSLKDASSFIKNYWYNNNICECQFTNQSLWLSIMSHKGNMSGIYNNLVEMYEICLVKNSQISLWEQSSIIWIANVT